MQKSLSAAHTLAVYWPDGNSATFHSYDQLVEPWMKNCCANPSGPEMANQICLTSLPYVPW